MPIRIGKYQIMTNPFYPRTLVSITPQEIESHEAALDTLSKIFEGNFPWKLSSGFAVATTIGKWYRVHRDIDVLITEDHLQAMVDTLKQHGFALFIPTLRLRVTFSRKIDIFKAVTPDEVLHKKLPQVYFVKTDDRGFITQQSDLLHHIDTYIYKLIDGEIRSKKFPRRTPASYLEGHTYTTCSGRRIELVHLNYVAKVKSIGYGEVDRCDRKLIQEWIRSQ